jgi:hypothetical protein
MQGFLVAAAGGVRRAAMVALLATLAFAAVAQAHVERSSYWPDPAPDRHVHPAAGGAVPNARTLASALDTSARGETRVVCKPDSLALARTEIVHAYHHGYVLRPSLGRQELGRTAAQRLLRINVRLSKLCRYRDIQAAVFDSGNNDRVVVMPGHYLERPSRAAPTNDPNCDQYREPSENGVGAASYEFQVKCPNDQSLIYVQGRALTDKPVPYPPLADRHGIPDAGRCVRCNLQIEGSGVEPTDVLVDAAQDPRTPLRSAPDAYAKDVGMRVDRADGFVIRDMTFAHAKEHGLYIHETDGYLIDRTEWYYNGEYGALMFTSDHGLTQNCEAVGQGDSGVYPGGAPDTGEQIDTAFYGDDQRQNQTIRHCDLHHNVLGYSGTMGNATRVVNNEFYDNTTGIATDSFFAGGHPGYPQDSAQFIHNDVYSNNFNTYLPSTDVVNHVPVPVGVGILIAGGNNDEVAHNRIYDNWLRGTMLLTVPDAVSYIDKPNQITGVNSTSHRNRYHDNVMGTSPDGKSMPNGVDFWFDDFPGDRNNCWFRNGSVTSDPPGSLLPSNCRNVSTGLTYLDHAPEVIGCLYEIGVTEQQDPALCPWFATPPKPGTGAAAASAPSLNASQITRRAKAAAGLCDLLGSDTLSCAPFRGRP